MPTKDELENELAHQIAICAALRVKLAEALARDPSRLELDGIMFEIECGDVYISVQQQDTVLQWTRLSFESHEVALAHEFLGKWLEAQE